MLGMRNSNKNGWAGWRAFAAAGLLAAASGGLVAVPSQAFAQDTTEDGETKFKPFADVSKGYTRVVSTADGQSFYALWTRARDGAMLAELPRGWEGQKHFIALTVASGEDYAGLQQGDLYVYWKRMDNRMVLLSPQIDTRATGEAEVKSSVKRLFTDRVLLDVPIVAMGPSGQPVIDMKDLLAGRVRDFFGQQGNARLASIKTAKAFPKNIEISYEMPVNNGILKEFHYSISLIPDNTGYTPRVADERVGYFTTVYRDLSKFTEDEKWIRFINRWHVEKADPKLKVSPAKEPIVFYVDHTVPVRYRRWVREGILYWNKAFEAVGITDAIQVYQQDAQTGAHMDKDPEDVRYNFIRWLANDVGTAIGPSRVHPLTGQILDADVVLTDGWIRHFWTQFNDVMPELAMEGFSPETLAWLDRNPQWDPRLRLADPAQRDAILAERLKRGVLAYGGHPIGDAGQSPHASRERLMGTGEYDGLVNRSSQVNGLCLAAKGKAFDMSVMRMMLEIYSAEEIDGLLPWYEEAQPEGEKKEGEKKKEEKKYDTLDGIPDWFVGPLLADLTAHEVGHTLGLRHNFKASSIYTLDEINSDMVRGKKPFTGSVMDYTAANLSVKDGKLQGDLTMIEVGPYDMWAIEYGYGSDPKETLKRVADPLLVYGTDEDTGGPDPYARRYDFAKDPIAFAKQQMDMAKFHRGRLLDKFVKDGQSWSRARRGYNITLGLQTRSLSMMSNWVGGAFVNRDRKGDPNGRPPIQVVPVEQQREALRFCIDNAFYDEAFGLTPELLEKMTVDKWLDAGGGGEARQEPTFPIHDRIAGIQTSVLTMLMNPTTLRRVYDNEFRIAADKDALTLAELMETVTGSIFSELEKGPSSKATARQPYISSLRRNLQQETIARLIDLTLPSTGRGEAYKPVSNLATFKLRQLAGKIDNVIGDGKSPGNLDPYSFAHLSEARIRINKALDAGYIYNSPGAVGGMPVFMFGQPAVNVQIEMPRGSEHLSPEVTVTPVTQPETTPTP